MTHNDYLLAIEHFIAYGKSINGIYDLLIRGTMTKTQDILPEWSDIDLSVIVSTVTSSTYADVHKLYHNLLSYINCKISITIVSYDDIIGKRHLHGIKPYYYTHVLPNSRSLLVGNCNYLIRKYNFNKELIFDCYANVAYLIHELRNSYMKCNKSIKDKISYLKHLVKRAKHIIRNAIFIKSGHIEEKINQELFECNFANADTSLPLTLFDLKHNWKVLSLDEKNIQRYINYIINNIEIVYAETLRFINSL